MIVAFRGQDEAAGRLAYAIDDDGTSHELENYFPGQDFDWGPRSDDEQRYQLAYAILEKLGFGDHLLDAGHPQQIADRFSHEVLAGLPHDRFDLPVDQVARYLTKFRLKLIWRPEIVSDRIVDRER